LKYQFIFRNSKDKVDVVVVHTLPVSGKVHDIVSEGVAPSMSKKKSLENCLSHIVQGKSSRLS